MEDLLALLSSVIHIGRAVRRVVARLRGQAALLRTICRRQPRVTEVMRLLTLTPFRMEFLPTMDLVMKIELGDGLVTPCDAPMIHFQCLAFYG